VGSELESPLLPNVTVDPSCLTSGLILQSISENIGELGGESPHVLYGTSAGAAGGKIPSPDAENRK